jgi:hypothetical protein
VQKSETRNFFFQIYETENRKREREGGEREREGDEQT